MMMVMMIMVMRAVMVVLTVCLLLGVCFFHTPHVATNVTTDLVNLYFGLVLLLLVLLMVTIFLIHFQLRVVIENLLWQFFAMTNCITRWNHKHIMCLRAQLLGP